MDNKNFDRMQEILAYAVDVHAEAVVNSGDPREAWLTYNRFWKKLKGDEKNEKDFYHQFKAVQVNYFETRGSKESEIHRVNDEGIIFYYQGGFDLEKRRRKREKSQVMASIASAIAVALSVVVAVIAASISFQQKNLNELMRERHSELKEQMIFLKQRTSVLEDSIKSISVTLTNPYSSSNVQDTQDK